jgi:hypothetical protein
MVLQARSEPVTSLPYAVIDGYRQICVDGWIDVCLYIKRY